MAKLREADRGTESHAAAREVVQLVVGPANWAAVSAVGRILEGSGTPALQGLLVEGPHGSGRSALLRWAAAQLPAQTVVAIAAAGGKGRDFPLEPLRRPGARRSVAVIDDLDRAVDPANPGCAKEILESFARAGGRIIATALESAPGIQAARTVILDAMPRRSALVSLFPPTSEMLGDHVQAELAAARVRIPDGLDLASRFAPIGADFRLAGDFVRLVREQTVDGKISRGNLENALHDAVERWKAPGELLGVPTAKAAIEARLGRGPISRHALAYALRCRTHMSFQAIAHMSGVKTGSAAFKAVRKMAQRVRLDPDIRRAVEEGVKALGGKGT